MKTLIMKFGGAAFADLSLFSDTASIIASARKEFPRIVVVVSAMGKSTDRLIEMATSVNPSPPQREYDMLISSGERISMSLLAMALAAQNQKAMSFTGSQSGIITCSSHSNAKIISIKPGRLEEALNEGYIAIVAGFQGVSEKKEITTLGRGGSDTSAVALGLALHAERVEFYKDVDGIYDKDPHLFPEARPYPFLTYEDASAIVERGAKVLHLRSIDLAAKNGLPLHVRSFISYKESLGTRIFNAGKIRREVPFYEVPESSAH